MELSINEKLNDIGIAYIVAYRICSFLALPFFGFILPPLVRFSEFLNFLFLDFMRQ